MIQSTQLWQCLKLSQPEPWAETAEISLEGHENECLGFHCVDIFPPGNKLVMTPVLSVTLYNLQEKMRFGSASVELLLKSLISLQAASFLVGGKFPISWILNTNYADPCNGWDTQAAVVTWICYVSLHQCLLFTLVCLVQQRRVTFSSGGLRTQLNARTLRYEAVHLAVLQ